MRFWRTDPNLGHRWTARVRLTLFYGGLSLVFGVLLVGLILTVVFAVWPKGRIAISYGGSWGTGDFIARTGELKQAQAESEAALRTELAIGSAVAVGVMTLVALGASWAVAGRILARTERFVAAQRLFTANASHELRGPIAAQRALVDVHAARPDASPDVRDLAGSLRKVLVRQERLVTGLFELASGQHGVRRWERLCLATMAREVLERWRPLAGDVEIIEELRPCQVRGDPVLVDILLDNLVRNAITHNVPGGRVWVGTGSGAVSVVNSGPVVSQRRLAQLTEPFRRGERDRASSVAGSGLGLAIVDTVVKAHGGELHLSAPAAGGMSAIISFR